MLAHLAIRTAFGAVLLAAILAAPARAAKGPGFVVNSTADADDGACTTDANGCTLREAIVAVNAGPGRRIGFDPQVFPPGAPATIALTTPLPAITVSGASVDGAGAGVTVDGFAADSERGLAFESPTGEPLTGVRVAHLALARMEGVALRICAGVPGCDAPLANVRIEDVAIAESTGDGIRIEGASAAKIRIARAIAISPGGFGIFVRATATSLAGVSVDESAVVDAEEGSLSLRAAETLSAVRVLRTSAVRGDGGIAVEAQGGMRGVKVIGNRAVASFGSGIFVGTGSRAEGLRVERNVTFGGGSHGISVAVPPGSRVRVARNTTAGHLQNGIVVNGPAVVLGNRADDNELSGILLATSTSRSRVSRNVTMWNRSGGIAIAPGETGIRLDRNVAFGNAPADLIEANGCDANVWSANESHATDPLCISARPAPPRTDLVVNGTADGDDGSCTAELGGCTLREAILAVNAGPARSIGFDPIVFAPGAATPIVLTQPLPVVAPSGASIDATGASVTIDGAATAGDGLVLGSAAGTALADVRVENLILANFTTGSGLLVCAALPTCDGALDGVVVRRVVVRDAANSAIRIAGLTIAGADVASSLAASAGDGISIKAQGGVSEVAVTGSSAIAVGFPGIEVASDTEVSRATVADNLVIGGGIRVASIPLRDVAVLRNRSFEGAVDGVSVQYGSTGPVRVEGNEVYANVQLGLFVQAEASVVGNGAVANGEEGFIASEHPLSITGNRFDANGTGGVRIFAGMDGATFRKNTALGNGGPGLEVEATPGANRFDRNLAIGNAPLDLLELNAGCGTNAWTRNAFFAADPLDCIR
jgi:CSLREA domain-containing protein